MKKILCFLILFSVTAEARLQIVATIPDIAEVATAVGGPHVVVETLLNGQEDPHYAEARPSYVLKLRKADLVCHIGMELESSWLMKAIDRAGNKKIHGNIGDCELGKSIDALEVPTGTITRALGDIHAHGNPHFMLSPVQIQKASLGIAEALSKLNPAHSEDFRKNANQFNQRIQALFDSLKEQIPATTVMEYHREFTYFFHDYGLKSIGSLEEKPGMPPSSRRIAEAAALAKKEGVQILFATPSAPHKVLERFTELSGIPVATVPSYVQTFRNSKATSVEELQKILTKAITP